jgi:hypothetical protein
VNKRFPFRVADGQVVGTFASPELSASDRAVAVFAEGIGRDGSQAYREYYSAAPGSEFTRIATCSGGESVEMPPLDADGPSLAFPDCDGSVRVRDVASGADQRFAKGDAVRVAGRYVAWLDERYTRTAANSTADLVVFDRQANAEVYRIPYTAIPARVVTFDLDDTGRVAVVYRQPRTEGFAQARVALASPSQPALQPMDLPAADFYDVRLAGGALAFERGVRESLAVESGEVGVVDLANGSTRIAGTGATAYEGRSNFDFDGQRLAWAHNRCEYSVVVAHDLDEPARTERPRAGCALRLLKRPRATRSGAVTLVLRCSGFRDGKCGARVTLTTADRAHHRVASGQSPGGRVRLRLSGSPRRAAASRGGLRVRVNASVFDASGQTERRSVTLRIRR